MKKIYILLIIIALLFLLLFSCQRTYELPLHQQTSQITKIELCDHTSGKRVVLCELNEAEFLPFMEKLEAVSCYRYFNDPSTDNGFLSVYLYYEDGIIDILGTGMCDTTSIVSTRKGWYYLDGSETWDLFSEYIPRDQLPPK